MNYLVAVLIKNESEPKFFLIKDPSSEKEAESLIKACKVEKEMIEKMLFMGSSVPDPVYLKNLINKDGEMIVSENFNEELKTDKVRQNRKILLEQTDKDYLQAFSMNDQSALKRVNEKKQFLRDLTKKPLIKNGRLINLFFNISDLIIEDPGSGYDFPPNISIGPPDSEKVPDMLKMKIGSAGEQAEATCSIKNGALDFIIMKNWGSGYFYPPSITVERPTSKDSRTAILSPVIINVLILEQ